MRCDMGVVGNSAQRVQSLHHGFCVSRIVLERTAIESDSLVCENTLNSEVVLPSTAEHVKFCENLPRPWGKAKYYLMTDSELVP